MTDAEIDQLKCGDIIMIDRGERSYFRTVIEGPADCQWKRCNVTVAKRQRSQYNRTMTILDRYFLRHNAVATGMKAKKMLGGDEVSRLIDMGFNVAKEIVRELKEAADYKARVAGTWMGINPRLKSDRCKVITEKLLRAASEYRTLKTE